MREGEEEGVRDREGGRGGRDRESLKEAVKRRGEEEGGARRDIHRLVPLLLRKPSSETLITPTSSLLIPHVSLNSTGVEKKIAVCVGERPLLLMRGMRRRTPTLFVPCPLSIVPLLTNLRPSLILSLSLSLSLSLAPRSTSTVFRVIVCVLKNPPPAPPPLPPHTNADNLNHFMQGLGVRG